MKTKARLLSIAAALLASLSSQAISLDIVPGTTSVTLGTPVAFELRISGLGDGVAPSLAAYDLTLGFDPIILGFGSFSFGDPGLGDQLDLSGLGTASGIDGSVAGELSVFEISFDSSADLNSLQAPSFTLGTISFNTLATGTSGLQFLGAPLLGDAEGSPLTLSLGEGSVEVIPSSTQAVPDASPTAAFLVLGLAALIALSRGPRVLGRVSPVGSH